GGTCKSYEFSFSCIGLILLYWVSPTVRTGQTLGRRLTYLMVVDRSTGQLPLRDRVVIKYAVPAVVTIMSPQLLGMLSVVAGFSFMMSRDGLSLLDRLGKTAVVVARYQPARPTKRR